MLDAQGENKTSFRSLSFPCPVPAGLAGCPSQTSLHANPASSPCQCPSVPVSARSELQSPPSPTPATTPDRSRLRSSCPLQAVFHMAARGSSPTQVLPFCVGGPQGLSPQACFPCHHMVPRPCLPHLPSITVLATPAACPHRPPLEPCPLLFLPPEFLPAWFSAGASTLQVSAQMSFQRDLLYTPPEPVTQSIPCPPELTGLVTQGSQGPRAALLCPLHLLLCTKQRCI